MPAGRASGEILRGFCRLGTLTPSPAFPPKRRVSVCVRRTVMQCGGGGGAGEVRLGSQAALSLEAAQPFLPRE